MFCSRMFLEQKYCHVICKNASETYFSFNFGIYVHSVVIHIKVQHFQLSALPIIINDKTQQLFEAYSCLLPSSGQSC